MFVLRIWTHCLLAAMLTPGTVGHDLVVTSVPEVGKAVPSSAQPPLWHPFKGGLGTKEYKMY